MTVKHYLQDTLLGLGERAYWSFYLATRRESPRLPSSSELKQMAKEHAAAAASPPSSSCAADLLLQVGNVLYAFSREANPLAEQEDLSLSLNLWAALQHYRWSACPGGSGAQQAHLQSLEPVAWRWDDRRGILLLDLSDGLSARLWPDLVFHRRLGLLKPSHVHTLAYDVAQRSFTNVVGERCALADLVQAPSTHLYLTRSVARFFAKAVPVQGTGPVLADVPGQSGRLF